MEELAEIKELKAKVRRLEQDNEILRQASIFFLRRGTRPPRPLIVAFTEEIRGKGHAVESICRVLCEQGCQVAARTYRAWSQPAQIIVACTLSDALVEDKVRELAWTIDEHGCRRLTPGGPVLPSQDDPARASLHAGRDARRC